MNDDLRRELYIHNGNNDGLLQQITSYNLAVMVLAVTLVIRRHSPLRESTHLREYARYNGCCASSAQRHRESKMQRAHSPNPPT